LVPAVVALLLCGGWDSDDLSLIETPLLFYKALAYSNVGVTNISPVNCGFDKSNPYNIRLKPLNPRLKSGRRSNTGTFK